MNWLLYFILNFVLYSFLGWCLEEVYSFFIQGYFKKDGFLKGPFKPMYGTAFCILDYFIEVVGINNRYLFIILVIVVPTSVEFISGYLLKKYFKKVYWSYLDNKFNYKGLICIKFSFYWSVMAGAIMLYFQPLVHEFYIYYNDISILSSLILGSYILIDFISTVRKYFNTRNHFELKERKIVKK